MERLAYNNLAKLYDSLMSYVPYQNWLEIIDRVSKKNIDKETISIFELGGGTGTLGSILAYDGYEYTGSDYSEGMCRVAWNKGLNFSCIDARSIGINKKFDMVIFLFDGINYLQTLEEYEQCFNEVSNLLSKDGIFLFDTTTEHNSLTHFDEYQEAESFETGAYIRHSYYEPASKTQHNEFEMFVEDPKTSQYSRFIEHHKQKIFSPEQVIDAIPKDLFSIEAMYDGFSDSNYKKKSERIHYLLRRI
jgi:SAM-dependent methyltransferase